MNLRLFKDRIINKIELKTNWLFASKRKKLLNNTDFTIISNNCWGGHVYECFGLQKQSPTVGCWFFAEDYLKFVENFNEYIKKDLTFIELADSRHRDQIIEHGGKNLTAPIGLLGDVEIIFMHYPNRNIALEKWNRRIKRINYKNLIFKFSCQNGCTDENIKYFDELDLNGKKICFTRLPNQAKCGVYYPGFEKEKELIEIFSWKKNFDLVKFLNMPKYS